MIGIISAAISLLMTITSFGMQKHSVIGEQTVMGNKESQEALYDIQAVELLCSYKDFPLQSVHKKLIVLLAKEDLEKLIQQFDSEYFKPEMPAIAQMNILFINYVNDVLVRKREEAYQPDKINYRICLIKAIVEGKEEAEDENALAWFALHKQLDVLLQKALMERVSIVSQVAEDKKRQAGSQNASEPNGQPDITFKKKQRNLRTPRASRSTSSSSSSEELEEGSLPDTVKEQLSSKTAVKVDARKSVQGTLPDRPEHIALFAALQEVQDDDILRERIKKLIERDLHEVDIQPFLTAGFNLLNAVKEKKQETLRLIQERQKAL